MPNDIEPIVGNWYCHLSKGQLFQVVGLDEDEGLVEIQRFDGDLEAIDLDTWMALDIELGEPPEDWTGPVDDLELDDLDYSATDMDRTEWRHSTAEYPQGRETWEPFDGESELDDWDEDELLLAAAWRRSRRPNGLARRDRR